MESTIISVLDSVNEVMKRVNENYVFMKQIINRLIVALIIFFVTVCLTAALISGFYFFSSYEYPGVDNHIEQNTDVRSN